MNEAGIANSVQSADQRRADTRVPSLDGLRAISVLIVVASHFVGTPRAISGVGTTGLFVDGKSGVKIFFVISGYIITRLLLEEMRANGSLDFPGFYLRRVLRLIPVQICYLLFLAIISMTTAAYVPACVYVSALTFTKNYYCATWLDGHFWSLSVEEQFYLIWPVLLWKLRPNMLRWVVAGGIALAPLSRAFEYVIMHTQVWTSSNMDFLLVGCALTLYAGRVEQLWDRYARGRVELVFLLALLGVGIPSYLGHLMILGPLTITIGSTMQAVGIALLLEVGTRSRRGWLFRILNWPPLVWVGLMSYSIYVWQMAFFSGGLSYGTSFDIVLRFPFDLVAVAVAGIASYSLIERPLARLRSRLHHRISARTRLAPNRITTASASPRVGLDD